MVGPDLIKYPELAPRKKKQRAEPTIIRNPQRGRPPKIVPPPLLDLPLQRERPSAAAIIDWIQRKCIVPEGKLLAPKAFLHGGASGTKFCMDPQHELMWVMFYVENSTGGHLGLTGRLSDILIEAINN